MDFFKSVFSADPTSPRQQDSPSESPHHSPDGDGRGSFGGSGETGGWSFGGIVKTFATKSESVIRTYRRDLEEFGSGLKKETAFLGDATARAVLDLPGSLDAGASVAQESLESVGRIIDDIGGSVWRGTAEIISRGKEAIMLMEADAGRTDQYPFDHGPQNGSPASRRYNRFEAQLLAIQSDANTFSEEPEDAPDFKKWRLGFDLAEKEDEIERLCNENGSLEGFLEKLVPRLVDYETFWCRYYYRVHKLKQAQDARAKLVKRVISGEEEEDLSWEVDDDAEDEEVEKDDKKEEILTENKEVQEGGKKDDIDKVVQKEDMNFESVVVEKHAEVSQVENLETSTANIDEGVSADPGKAENPELICKEEMNSKSDDETDGKTVQKGKTKDVGLCKDSSSSIVSSQHSVQEEDDLEWDEIEDLDEHDEKKSGDESVDPLREDLRKRLSVVEDDEDLSWDIEDDDVSTKS
ncbi:unnamed protein product [Musa textilis]